jgi:hypothetical protein
VRPHLLEARLMLPKPREVKSKLLRAVRNRLKLFFLSCKIRKIRLIEIHAKIDL